MKHKIAELGVAMETVNHEQAGSDPTLNSTTLSSTELADQFTATSGRTENLITRAQYYLSLEVPGIILTIVASVGLGLT